jgi:hypothetical protein
MLITVALARLQHSRQRRTRRMIGADEVDLDAPRPGIDGKAFAADKALLDAPLQDGLEQLPQEIAFAEAAMAVLRKGRVVGHVTVRSGAEPAVGQVQVHLFTQPPFRANAEAVADDQHSDQQLRIDRRPTRLAVERRQVCPKPIEFDEAVDAPEQMRLGDVSFARKLVKQRLLLDLAFAHHRLHSGFTDQSESATPNRCNPKFFNKIAPFRSFAISGLRPGMPANRASAIGDQALQIVHIVKNG